MKKNDRGDQEQQRIKRPGLWIDATRLPTRLAQKKTHEPTLAMARLTTENEDLHLKLPDFAQ